MRRSHSSVPDQAGFLALFDALVDVMFCTKDLDGRYTAVNQAFVARTGKPSKRDVVGLHVRDLFSPDLAERYQEQDDHVFSTGEPLRDELELIRRPDGSLGWYLTTKLPVHENGELSGLSSVSRDLKIASDREIGDFGSLADIVRSQGRDVRVADLAAAASCTTHQLERLTKRLYGLTPTQFVLRVRVDHAADLLVNTRRPISEIALESGFYDQSDLTKQFGRLIGETPGQFRDKRRS